MWELGGLRKPAACTLLAIIMEKKIRPPPLRKSWVRPCMFSELLGGTMAPLHPSNPPLQECVSPHEITLSAMIQGGGGEQLPKDPELWLGPS